MFEPIFINRSRERAEAIMRSQEANGCEIKLTVNSDGNAVVWRRLA